MQDTKQAEVNFLFPLLSNNYYTMLLELPLELGLSSRNFIRFKNNDLHFYADQNHVELIRQHVHKNSRQ